MKRTFSLCVLLLLFLGGCKKQTISPDKKTTLTAVGGTLPLPFYSIRFSEYPQTKVIANEYSSGAGIRSIKDKLIDLAGTDSPLTDKEIQHNDGEILHIPTCLGAVVIAFNLPGISELNMTGPLLSQIYLQKITYWDDLRIQTLNPDVRLPHLPITLIYRSDRSGTSYVFSDYLCKTSPEWNEKMGRGRALYWKSGIAVKGNIMAAGTIKNIPGAIGYIGSGHAAILELPTAAIQNAHNEFIKANKRTILASTDGLSYPDDMRIMISNSPNEGAYPLSCLSWLLVYKNQAYLNRSEEKYQSLVDFLNYMITPQTQSLAGRMSYAPLPEAIIEKAQRLIDSMEWKEEYER